MLFRFYLLVLFFLFWFLFILCFPFGFCFLSSLVSYLLFLSLFWLFVSLILVVFYLFYFILFPAFVFLFSLFLSQVHLLQYVNKIFEVDGSFVFSLSLISKELNFTKFYALSVLSIISFFFALIYCHFALFCVEVVVVSVFFCVSTLSFDC